MFREIEGVTREIVVTETSGWSKTVTRGREADLDI